MHSGPGYLKKHSINSAVAIAKGHFSFRYNIASNTV